MGKNIGTGEDQMRSLNGSVVMYKGEWYIVYFEYGESRNRIEICLGDGKSRAYKHRNVEHTSDDFVYRKTRKIGFVNCTENRSDTSYAVLLSRTNGSGHYGYNSQDYYSLSPFDTLQRGISAFQLLEHFKSKWPTWQHALALVRDRHESCAFDDDFAFKRVNSMNIGLHHRRSLIGLIPRRINENESHRIQLIESPTLSFSLMRLADNGHKGLV
jgi:hypothetical protein